MTTGYGAYNRSAQAIENKEIILLKLYKGAIRFVQFAQKGLELKNVKVKGENISKTIAILNELDIALDKKVGGDLAKNLSALYNYMINRLSLANTRNDVSILEEVKILLQELNDGFEGAVKDKRNKLACKQQGYGGGASKVEERVTFAV
jgi:flagellar secretion chaperone FliS